MTIKHDLLAHEQKGWLALRERLEVVGDLERPGASGEWSTRDVIAHVSSWHQQLTAWLEAWRLREEKPGPIAFEGNNAIFHSLDSVLSLDEVLARAPIARDALRDELTRMPEPIPDGWARLVETICSNHYEEHIPDLDRFLEGR